MGPTINDFRNILGKVNDGNVVFTEDNHLQKVNHGGVISRKIYGYATAPNDVNMNIRVRQAFYDAISNSVEARAMMPEMLKAIAEKLGLWGNAEELEKPLMRREISEVLDMVGKAVNPRALIAGTKFNIEQLGESVLDMAKAQEACDALEAAVPLNMTKPEEFARFFQQNEFGHTQKDYAKFIRGNDAVIKMMAFDRLYWQAMEGKPLDGKAAYRDSLIEMMKGYAEGKMPVLKTDRLASMMKPPAVEIPNDLQVRFDSVAKDMNDLLSELTKGMPNGSFGSLLVETMAGHLKAELAKTFVTTFEANRNNPNAADIAEEAYRSRADGLTAMFKGALEVKEAWQSQPKGSDISFMDVFVKLVNDKFGILSYGEASSEELAGTFVEVANDLAECSATRLVKGYCDSVFTDEATKEQLEKPFLDKVQADANPVDLNKLRVAFIKEKLGCVDAGMNEAKTAVEAYLSRTLDDVRKSILTPEQVKANKEAAINSLYEKFGGNDPAMNIIRRTIGFSQAEALGICENSQLLPGGEEKLKDELMKFSVDDLNHFATYAKFNGRSMDNDLELKTLQAKYGYDAYKAFTMSGIGFIKPPFLTAIKNGILKADVLTEGLCFTLMKVLQGGLRISAAQSADGGGDDAESSFCIINNLLSLTDVAGRCKADDDVMAAISDMADRFVAKTAEFAKVLDSNTSLGRCKLAVSDYKQVKADPNATKDAKLDAMRNLFNEFDIMIWGLGVGQIDEMLPTLSRCGLKLEDLNSTDLKVRMAAIERLIVIMNFSELNGHHIDELPEFIERMTKKPLNQVGIEDLAKFMADRMCGIKPVDPNTTLSAEQIKLPDALRGVKKFSEVDAKTSDIIALRQAITNFNRDGHAEVKMFGVTGTLVRRPDGEIDLKVGENALFHIGNSLDRLGLLAEDELVAVADKLTTQAEKDLLISILPPVPQPGSTANLLRARELYLKTIAVKLNVLTSTLSSVPTARLREIAVAAMKGANAATFPELSAPPTEQFNSEEMVEMHQKMLNTSTAVVDAKVQMPKVVAVKSLEERKETPFTGDTARKILADLFMNQDTWSFDAISKNPNAPQGDRIKNVLAGYGPELANLKTVVADEAKLKEVVGGLPPAARDQLAAILKEIANINLAKASQEQYAALERKISDTVDTIMTSMQTIVSSMFKAKVAQDTTVPWQQSLKDVGGTSVGLDLSTTHGRFVKGVIDNYFIKSKSVDKRAMLAAFLRNTDGNSTDGKQVAELLKGAGPLLQKILQGLPIDTFPKETQIALKDMKSKLAPIPEDAVRAQLLELVNSSNGHIRSIEVKKSAGAASVAQTFICNIKTDEHPVDGIDCVIKVLRPSAQTAIHREKELFDQVIANDQSLKTIQTSFDGQFGEIIKELDFTLEAKNVEMGFIGYERPVLSANDSTEHLHSMQILKGCVPTMGAMVVSKAPGEPVDSYIGKTLNEAKAIIDPMITTTQLGEAGPKVTVCHAPDSKTMANKRKEIANITGQVLSRRQDLAKTLDSWFTRAVYGDGFFHADMHAGNIMTSPDSTTIIDFGNCMRLSKTEQENLKFIVLACRQGDAERFSAHFKSVLPESAKSTFSKVYDAHKAEFEEIFRKGSPNDMVPRFFAAMSRLQELGVAVPTALYAFAQSYGRFAAAITEMDELMVSLKTMSLSIGLSPAAQNRIASDVGEQPKLVLLFQKMVDIAYCTEGGTFIEDSVRAVRDELKSYLSSEEGKADIQAMVMDKNKAEVLNNLLKNLNKVENGVYLGSSANTFVSGDDHLTDMINAAVKHDEESSDYQDALVDLPQSLDDLASELCRFLERMLPEQLSASEQPTPEEILAYSTVREMSNILTNKAMAVKFGIMYAGLIGSASLQGKIEDVNDLADAIAECEMTAVQSSTALNGSLDFNERLTGVQLNEVRKIRKNGFRAPNDDTFEKAGWHTDGKKVGLMISVLKFNLEQLAKGLKLEAGDPIPSGMIKIAFSEFSTVYRAGKFKAGLSENVKAALLAKAGDDPALQQAINAL